MTLFAYAFNLGIHPDFWSAPPGLGSLGVVVALYLVAAGLALLGRRLLSRKATRWTPPTQLLLAAPMIAAAPIVDLMSWRSAGFDPQLSSQAALVHAFLSQQGLLGAICAVMALYMAARASRGLITAPRNNSFDMVTIFIVYTAVQGCATAVLTRSVALAL